MKLSEAIRLGAMLKPQGFGVNSIKSDSPDTCALGAAADAVGITHDYADIYTAWPWTAKNCKSPFDDRLLFRRDHEDALSIIWKLNDVHRWTREQIADWVATIEPSESPVDITHTADAVKELVGGSGRSGA